MLSSDSIHLRIFYQLHYRQSTFDEIPSPESRANFHGIGKSQHNQHMGKILKFERFYHPSLILSGQEYPGFRVSDAILYDSQIVLLLQSD